MDNGFYKIKTWKEMEQEFGVYRGSIHINCSFTPVMESRLPYDRIIEVRNNRWIKFSITEDMTKEYYGLEDPRTIINQSEESKPNSFLGDNEELKEKYEVSFDQLDPFVSTVTDPNQLTKKEQLALHFTSALLMKNGGADGSHLIKIGIDLANKFIEVMEKEEKK